MATQHLTDYERKRLENIKRNDEMMAALKIHAKASLLFTKRRRVESKSYKTSSDGKKKNRSESPVIIRRSLRTRGMPPDSTGLRKGFSEPPKPSPRDMCPLVMKDAYRGEGSDKKFIEAILGISNKPRSGYVVKEEIGSQKSCKYDEHSDSAVEHSVKRKTSGFSRLSNAVRTETVDIPTKVEKDEKSEFKTFLDVETLSLEPENIGRVVPSRIFVVKFMPSMERRMVAVGAKFGNVGFWNMDTKDENDGIYLYRPHLAPVSSILFQPHSLSKVITSCYDGYIRLMDAEKEMFDLIYSGDDAIYSLSQNPTDRNNLYFGEGYGVYKVWDLRAGKSSLEWNLHDYRINTVDFNPRNPYMMATSSTDKTACLWDLRNVGAKKKPKALHTVNHEKAVHSAYFSPSGCSLATTSADNNVGLLSGITSEDYSTSMIYHYNFTGQYISNFRGVWGWDDSNIYIGNMGRGVDVISTNEKKIMTTLQSPNMTAIQCRFDAHPLNVGMLAGAAGGHVYVWTPK